MVLIIICAVIFLAYYNGANDNYKGVATLFGSGTASYKKALWWATLTTFLGSASAVYLAGSLVKNFSGKGLIPDTIISTVSFVIALGLGAAITVMFASKIGMPISTTHSILGSMIGIGFAASASQLNLAKLGSTFFLPLLLSPLISAIISYFLYRVFRAVRIASGIGKESCLCIGEQSAEPLVASSNSIALSNVTSDMKIKIGENGCDEIYSGKFIGLDAQKSLNGLHYLSAGAVSFARGLNDTPKIAALLLIVPVLNNQIGLILIGLAIAIGGLLSAKKVALTMSQKITAMNHGQGFTSNLTTSLLVIVASIFGLPVSTTHVSVGSLLGIGSVTKKANYKVIKEILLSWVFTLPVAALFSMIIYFILTEL